VVASLRRRTGADAGETHDQHGPGRGLRNGHISGVADVVQAIVAVGLADSDRGQVREIEGEGHLDVFVGEGQPADILRISELGEAIGDAFEIDHRSLAMAAPNPSGAARQLASQTSFRRGSVWCDVGLAISRKVEL